MNKSAIFHKTGDNFCYALDKDNLIITLHTGFDITDVSLCYGDPYTTGIMGGNSKWIYDTEAITHKSYLEDAVLWKICVKPPFKRCSYFFRICCNDEVCYYFEDGFHNSTEPEHGERPQYFIFPWMNPVDINTVPDWVNDTVWYQIFPDRFCNGDSSLNGRFVKDWKGPEQPVGPLDIYGGDIPGIISRLDYLHELGITGLYFTPLCAGKSNHKYDTADYLKIDPAFGTNEQMRELVDKAHSLGMRVMMDGVFNHCSTHFAPWKDVCRKGHDSKYFDWFMINNWPFSKIPNSNSKKGNYYSFAFFDMLPKLNTNNPEVIRYLTHVCMTWIKEFDIDAIRLDVANEVSHSFLQTLRKNLKKLKPDFFLLGELWHDSMPWLRGNELDSVMNYTLKDSINDFWLNTELTNENLTHAVNRCYNMYMGQTNDVLFNLLDSHDTIRLISQLKNPDKFYQEMALMLLMPGTPCLYYGSEVMLEGMHDPDCRRCMPWDKIDNGFYRDSIERTKKLINLRKNNPAAKSSVYRFVNNTDNGRLVQFEKYDIDYDKMFSFDFENDSFKGQKITVILNCSDTQTEVCPDGKILFSNLFTDNVLSPNGTIIYSTIY